MLNVKFFPKTSPKDMDAFNVFNLLLFNSGLLLRVQPYKPDVSDFYSKISKSLVMRLNP